MTDLLENGTTGDLRNSPAHAQVVRRWTATVLMYFSTVLGALATFGFTEDIGSPKSSGISESAQLALIGVGAGLALLCVLPTVGLARRIRLREAKAGWTTIVVGCLVLIAAGVGFFGFLVCGVLLVIVGLPLTKFRATSQTAGRRPRTSSRPRCGTWETTRCSGYCTKPDTPSP